MLGIISKQLKHPSESRTFIQQVLWQACYLLSVTILLRRPKFTNMRVHSLPNGLSQACKSVTNWRLWHLLVGSNPHFSLIRTQPHRSRRSWRRRSASRATWRTTASSRSAATSSSRSCFAENRSSSSERLSSAAPLSSPAMRFVPTVVVFFKLKVFNFWPKFTTLVDEQSFEMLLWWFLQFFLYHRGV